MKKIVFTVLFTAVFCLGTLPQASFVANAQSTTEIWDRAGLEAIANEPTAHYTLMADIDMGDAPWGPIPFEGTFEGGGHTLYNLTITESDPVYAESVDGNRKSYDTVYAALFSRTKNAVINDLTLLGVHVDITTDENVFASGLVGYAENTTITNCHVSGRVYLHSAGIMCGVSGMTGFGYGTITDSSADVTLVLVDENEDIKCEEFMGAMLATGYMDMQNCTVDVRAYTSVYGYVHNGGVVGMYYVHTDDSEHAGYINGCTVNAEINFFEANDDRRAYSAAVVGEQLHWPLELEDNTVEHFDSIETTDYDTPLYPEGHAQPVYTQSVVEPTCDSFGYTLNTCEECGYSYADSYVAHSHQPGEWQTLTPATPTQNGLRQRVCEICGDMVEEQALIGVAELGLSIANGDSATQSLALQQGESSQLITSITPQDATDQTVVYTSSDDAVATVDSTGLVSATGSGSATITATAQSTNVSAQYSVEVSSPLPMLPMIVGGITAVGALTALLITLKFRRNARRTRRHTQHNVYRRK